MLTVRLPHWLSGSVPLSVALSVALSLALVTCYVTTGALLACCLHWKSPVYIARSGELVYSDSEFTLHLEGRWGSHSLRDRSDEAMVGPVIKRDSHSTLSLFGYSGGSAELTKWALC